MGALRHLRQMLILSLLIGFACPASFAEGKDLSKVNSHSSSSDLKDRLTQIETHLKNHPDDSVGYGAKSEVLMWLGDIPNAFLAINKSIELNPTYPGGYQGRAVIHMKANEQNKAILDLTKAIELGKSTPQVYAARGSSRLIVKDFKGALEDAEISLKKKPEYATALFIKGTAASELGQNEVGIEYLNRAIKADSSDPIYFHHRALVYERMGLADRAKADFAKAKQLGYESKIEAEGRRK